ncbi:MAG: hypothetical protein QME12_08235 [Nanoarchaeota archaeon]|nr:hypothetical protein [Nanoarchaeota archaeon]
MTSKEIHKEHIREHMQEIEDAIAIGIERRPATIGLHVSACSIELLELYLHTMGKITAGSMIKHEWFKAPKPGQKIEPLADRKLRVFFPAKDEILDLMYSIEDERNKTIYGKPSNVSVGALLAAFQKLHKIIKERLHEWGEEIE